MSKFYYSSTKKDKMTKKNEEYEIKRKELLKKKEEKLYKAILALNNSLDCLGIKYDSKCSINEKLETYCNFVGISEYNYDIKLLIKLFNTKKLRLQHKTNESPLEKRCEDILIRNNVVYENQKIIGDYRVDFYIPSKNLIIEVDGRAFHSGKQQLTNDYIRQNYLIKSGYKILRYFPEMINNGIMDDINSIDY